MKNIIYLLFVIIGLSLTSCGKEEKMTPQMVMANALKNNGFYSFCLVSIDGTSLSLDTIDDILNFGVYTDQDDSDHSLLLNLEYGKYDILVEIQDFDYDTYDYYFTPLQESNIFTVCESVGPYTELYSNTSYSTKLVFTRINTKKGSMSGKISITLESHSSTIQVDLVFNNLKYSEIIL